jgi:hypothetical protein
MLPSAEIAKKNIRRLQKLYRERERERFIFSHQMCIYISYKTLNSIKLYIFLKTTHNLSI